MPPGQPPGSTNTQPAPVISQARAAWALALLLGLQPIATDVYLPALPALAQALGTGMDRAQLTLSALMLAFGFGQLVWGPVADRVGRRPVLLCGLLLYTAASVGAALVSTVDALIAWRAMQGATLAAAVVCARATVRDLYEPTQGARVMSMGLSGLGVIAICGPLLGGAAAAAWGWRGALALLAVAGTLALAFVALRLPETLRQRNPQATQLGPLLLLWGRIARHPVFVAWALLVAFTYGGLYTVLAGSSFVYMRQLGLSPLGYGLAMAVGSMSYLTGTFVCRRWITRYGMAGAVARGAGSTLAGGLLGLALALAGVHTVWAVLLPQCLLAFGHGIHQPCGQAGAVGPFPQAAGAASALAGFILSLVAFGVGLWLGKYLGDSVLPYVACIALWSVATATVAWTLVQTHAKTARLLNEQPKPV
jgi:MFS transporter, DHA1 family, multidrug resistance protein